MNICQEVLVVCDNLHLPKAKPRVLELTDAGPGVGCNNGAVQYRMAEQIIIHGLDKVVRVHRARGESGQNEVMCRLATHSLPARLFNGITMNVLTE